MSQGYVVTVHNMEGSMGEACESLFTVLTLLRDEAEEIRQLLTDMIQSKGYDLYVTWHAIDIDLEVSHSRGDLLDKAKAVFTKHFDS